MLAKGRWCTPVTEGHIGIYHRGGALLSVITEPGIHLKLPVITRFDEIQVTVQVTHGRVPWPLLLSL